jgi:hypothetical protein
MAILNLTPHTVIYDDGKIRKELPSDGNLRLVMESIPSGTIDGMDIVEAEYGDYEGLPEIQPGDTWIVSSLVADARGGMLSKLNSTINITTLVPDSDPTAKRENGQIVSICRFIRK